MRRIKSKAIFTIAFVMCSYTHPEMYVYIYSHTHRQMYGNMKFKNIFFRKLVREAKDGKMNLWLEKRSARKRNSKYLRNKKKTAMVSILWYMRTVKILIIIPNNSKVLDL